MLKMKKLLSIVLAALMILSSVSIVSANTTEDLTITYWNADSTKITLDFSEEVDVTELTNAITLTLGGVDVPFTVAKKDKTVTTTIPDDATFATAATVKPLTSDADVTYTITPNGGVSFGVVYTLTVAAGLQSADDSAALASEWKKGIKLNKLWIEDFDDYTDTDATPWYISGATTSSLVADANGGKALYLTKNGSGLGYIRPIKSTSENKNYSFADTNTLAATYWASNSNASMMKDYNIELDAKIQTASDMTYQHYIRIGMNGIGHDTNMQYGANGIVAGVGAYGSAQRLYANTFNQNSTGYAYASTYEYEANGANMETNSDWMKTLGGAQYSFEDASTEEKEVGGHSSLLKNTNSGDLNDTDFTNDLTNKLIMSVKEKNIRLNVNDNGFISYNYSADDNGTLPTTKGNGLPYIVFSSNGGVDSKYVFDNIIVTKAEEVVLRDVTVSYWNADSSKIIIDLSSDVDVNALKNKLTLTKNGEEIAYTITEKTKTATGTDTLALDTATTYVIVPTGGMTVNDIYGVVIESGIAAEDGNGTLTSDYTKFFKVNKLMEENFESFEATDELPWKTYSANETVVTSLDSTSDGNRLKWVTGTSNVGLITNGNCKPDGTNAYWTDAQKAVTDYTVEIDVKFDSANTSNDFLLVMQPGRSNNNLQYTDAIWGGAFQSGTTYKMTAGASENTVYSSEWEEDSTNEKANQSYLGAGVASTANPWDSTGYNKMTLAVKNRNIKTFAGSTAFSSYYYGSDINVEDYGWFGFTNKSAGTFYIDNVVVTKAEELTGIEYGAIAVTNAANDTAITALSQATSIDAAMKVINMDAALPCKIVLAIYDSATGAMKNVAIGATTSIAGVTDVAFDNIAVNGGDTLRIFFWDSLNALVPYRNSVDWPAAE